jgi:HEAT repeat protein
VTTDRAALVPRFEVSDIDLMDAFDDLGATTQEPPEDARAAWTLDGATVTYVLDSELDIELLAVEGPRRDQVAQQLRDRIPTFSSDDMPSLFRSLRSDSSGTELSHRLGILTAVAPERAEPELVKLFQRGFEHGDWLVRRRAAFYASMLKWPELRPLVEHLATDDPDESVRETAAVALRDFDS